MFLGIRKQTDDRLVTVTVVLTLAALAIFLLARSSAPARPVLPVSSTVVVGTVGLSYEDVHAGSTPNLAELAEEGRIANNVVRSVDWTTCPADGWLALNTGNRLSLPRQGSGAADVACAFIPEPSGAQPQAEHALPAGGPTPLFAKIEQAAASQSYGAKLGLLGDIVADHQIKAASVGPGAALALTRSDGTRGADHYAAGQEVFQLGSAVKDAVGQHSLVIVDATPLSPAAPLINPSLSADAIAGRPSGLNRTPVGGDPYITAADKRIGAAVRAAQAANPRARIIVVSLADRGPVAQLRPLIMISPGEPNPGLARSASTQHAGLVQSLDLLPTIVDGLSLHDDDAAAELSGAIIAQAGSASIPARAAIASLADDAQHARVARETFVSFSAFLAISYLALLAVAGVAMSYRVRRAGGRPIPDPGPLASTMRLLRRSAATLACLPAAVLITNLLPTWRGLYPSLASFLVALALAAFFGWCARSGPWARRPLGSIGFIGYLTGAIITLDVLTGSQLTLSGYIGTFPQVGGRYFGVNNMVFGMLLASAVLAAGWTASRWVRIRHRRRAALSAAGVIIAAVVLDGSPSLGADFGGIPALFLAGVLLVAYALGIRVTFKRGVIAAAVAFVAALAVAAADYFRPGGASTHVGIFFGKLISGEAWPTLMRKLTQNLVILLPSLVAVAVAALGWYLIREIAVRIARWQVAHSEQAVTTSSDEDEETALSEEDIDLMPEAHWLRSTIAEHLETEPFVKPMIITLLWAIVVGVALNDSGMVIAAFAGTIAVPSGIFLLASHAPVRRKMPKPRPRKRRAQLSEAFHQRYIPEGASYAVDASLPKGVGTPLGR